MITNLLIFLVVSILVYWFVIRRIRWRIVRVLLYTPILVLVLSTVLVTTSLGETIEENDLSEIQALIVDEQIVIRKDLVVAISGSGSIQPIRQVPLVFSVPGQVINVYYSEGTTVEEGAIIANVDTRDLQSAIDNAQTAVDFQQSVLNNLQAPAREVDIAAAQAAVDAAQAQYWAALSTGPTAQQEEIARLQFELAKNRNWQLNLQRDAIVIPNPNDIPPTDLNFIPEVNPANFDPDLSDEIDLVNQQIDTLNGLLSGPIDEVQRQQVLAQIQQLEQQREALNNSLDDAATNSAIAEQNYLATVNRGPDGGSVASANASLVQAQVALDRLTDGGDELQLQQANNNLALAQNALSQAELALDNAQIVAPFDGVLSQNNLTVGEFPPQGIAVMLMDTSAYVVDLPIDETDIVNIVIGQRVEFQIDALPDAIVTGTVTRIAYTPVRIGQLVTYTVRVQLDPIEALLRVGMSITANIITQERPDVLTVGNRFIRIDPITQDAFVTIETTEGFTEVMVVLGQRNDVESEILSGLSENDRVVLLPRGTEGVEGFFN
jgi:HlyD family secretion protein